MITISEMLSRNARMYPQDIALTEICPSHNFRRDITWGDLDRQANKVANCLLELNVKKNDKVIHWMMNSIDWIIAYFGVLRSGAWVVPLNFRFTSNDFKYCADISEARVMIIGHEFVERVDKVKNDLSVKTVILAATDTVPTDMNSYHEKVSMSSERSLKIEEGYDDCCSLYFTSGTTGAPKPILLTQGNIESAAITEYAHHRQTREDNFILMPPLYHTGAKMHWYGSLITGGRATLLTEVNPRAIIETVHKERGSIVWLLVPWAYDILSALDNGDLNIRDYDLSCWRLMHIGAQPVPPSLVKRWKKYFPDMQYDTNYGLSESTGPGCVHLGIENVHKVGAIGKPGFNWEAKIMTETGNKASINEIGELAVRGNGVMKEYYKNPEKTNEALRNGWLYTGDMAKIDEEGFIYLVDRKKDVVISGGENIYPVEIEDTLHNMNQIRDVAVIGLPDERLGEIAVAIVEIKSGQSLAESEVIEFCKANIARHKVPRKVIFGKIPRNATGKIEKPKLRALYSSNI